MYASVKMYLNFVKDFGVEFSELEKNHEAWRGGIEVPSTVVTVHSQ
jgi:hypothetical protein